VETIVNTEGQRTPRNTFVHTISPILVVIAYYAQNAAQFNPVYSRLKGVNNTELATCLAFVYIVLFAYLKTSARYLLWQMLN